MDRFLLCENPVKDDGRVFILHTVAPRMLIEVIIDGDTFTYLNTDNVAEHYDLVPVITFDPVESEQLEHTLDRAWRWYRAYLKWEDDNIDTDEQARHN